MIKFNSNRGIKLIFLFILLTVFTKKTFASNHTVGEGHCIWYGPCDENPTPGKEGNLLNCIYNGEAKELKSPAAVNNLNEICPELTEEIQEYYDGQTYTCCNDEQIKLVQAQLSSLHAVLQKCPACYSNLRKNFCYFACHPRHSAFLNPTDTFNQSVLTVTQYDTYEYINAAFDSCKSVYFSALNGPALGVLCGPWGADECTPERLFSYFGDNFLAPFTISYEYSDTPTQGVKNITDGTIRTMNPLNPLTIPCNTSDVNMQCRCIDCEQACAAPPQPEPPTHYSQVGEVRTYSFVIIMIYSVFAVLFIALGIFRPGGFPGREEENIKCCTYNQEISANFEYKLQGVFEALSKRVTHHPHITSIVAIVLIVILSSGITMINMTTDPVELWASPTSRTRQEKDYYDKSFGPFYRTNQLIITPIGIDEFLYENNSTDDYYAEYNMGPVFNSTFLYEIFDLQLQIMALTADFEGQKITLNDICIKPLTPLHDDCLIQSVINYFQNNLTYFEELTYDENGNPSDKYLEHMIICFGNPSYINGDTTCMGSYGGPVFPYVAYGGFLNDNETLAEHPQYERSTALVMTFLNQNYVDKDKLGPALAWEKVYLNFMKNYSNSMMDIAYYAERSIQDEIERESKSDVSTILVSYLVMFCYVAISLGRFDSEKSRIWIETKITLGLCSVILVFLSVLASIGLCGFIGVQGTLFVLEVVPFLVLAVGVDNIFLLVQTWQREERLPDESIEDHIARVSGKVAPSMLIATCSEVICFFLGALSEMPAVHSFSIYAGVALAIDFLLQITCLVAFIALDAKRVEDNRYDVLCCVKSKGTKESKKGNDICMSFFKSVYSPLLFKDTVRAVVVLIFVGGFCTSCSFLPKMDIGLEQDIGMPDDSYVIKYFDSMAKYLSVGPPVYFVIKDGFDFTSIEEQNIVCQSTACNDDSILSQIFWASESPAVTSIATGANSWLDDYFAWISDRPKRSNVDKACCRLDENGNFINSSATEDPNTVRTCLKKNDFVDKLARPLPEYFMEYLPDFLIDNPHGLECPQAGHPAYGSSVVIEDKGCPDNSSTCVGASNFMAYHTILKKSKDFTFGLEKAYEITDYMNAYIRSNSTTPNVEIFPYSIFYVFYEQYLDMWTTVAVSLSASLFAVFLVMLLITGLDIRSTLINIIIIIMIIVDLMGLMIPWHIQLNAISLVNLVMAMGISVEFCSHITHAFALSTLPTKIERASESLIYTGSSVLSGITLTKLAGIIILVFASSQVITVFYFRMYLLIVFLGAAHGLIFLPVLLSFIGPSSNPYLRDGPLELDENEMVVPKSYVNKGFS